MSKQRLFALMMCCSLAPAVGGDQKEISSWWPANAIVIDGSEQEWAGAFTYLEKEKIAYAIKNDTSHLYLCVKFESATQRQALRFGFTVWLDPTGKNKRELGIRFPIGMQYYDTKGMPMAPGAMPPEEARRQRAALMLRELDILESDRNIRNRLPMNNTEGIQFAASDTSAELAFELKIPLHSDYDRPYALEANLNQLFSLGFEMGELDREKLRERMMGGGAFGGGRPSGGMPPGGGSGRPPGGGMGGGMPGGKRPGWEDMPKPFRVWMQVKLATPISQNQ